MSEEFHVVTQSVVNVIVTNSNNDFSAENRFQKSMRIAELKGRLELVTGVYPATMKLELYNKSNAIVANIDDDDALLGSYPIDNGMRIHVTGPGVNLNKYDDMSGVEKQDLSEEEYAKRNDTLRAYLIRNKIGKYAEKQDSDPKDNEKDDEEQSLAKSIALGSRCEVNLSGQALKRGSVKFVGETHFKPGLWVGIQYDEPLGKNDGSVDGKKYFSCPAKYGAFVRPHQVQVGDFPEESLDLDDEM